jgi:hypothetical protein
MNGTRNSKMNSTTIKSIWRKKLGIVKEKFKKKRTDPPARRVRTVREGWEEQEDREGQGSLCSG